MSGVIVGTSLKQTIHFMMFLNAVIYFSNNLSIIIFNISNSLPIGGSFAKAELIVLRDLLTSERAERGRVEGQRVQE